MTTTRLTAAEIATLAATTLQRHGCNAANANAVAAVIAAAERDGCHSHGLMRMPGYVAALDSGKVDGTATPEVTQLAPAVLRANGNGGFAPLALARARDPFIAAAHNCGVAALSLVNVHHFAALWTEVEPVAQAGLVCFACTSYKPAVIPAGGSKALYGTNPMAFGWPRPAHGAPLVFDQASSVMARGEVMLAAREQRALPAGVGVDALGNPSTDPDAVLQGALLAFGGHKGSSLALMVELLAGGLLGESFSFEAARTDNNDGGPPRGGEFMLALNPAMFGDAGGWADHAEQLFEQILAQDGTRLPGDRRYANRATAEREGIEVADATIDQLQTL